MGPGTATARTLGVQLESVEARTPVEIDNAFSSAAVKRAGAVIVLPDPVLLDHGARIADLAIRRRLPTISSVADHAQAGVLIVYGPSIAEGFRRAATYVDKILKGAKPGDLPVEQPTRFELTVNLRTAKALGLQIPRPILTRADQVIE